MANVQLVPGAAVAAQFADLASPIEAALAWAAVHRRHPPQNEVRRQRPSGCCFSSRRHAMLAPMETIQLIDIAVHPAVVRIAAYSAAASVVAARPISLRWAGNGLTSRSAARPSAGR
jgi:hypothetical protein